MQMCRCGEKWRTWTLELQFIKMCRSFGWKSSLSNLFPIWAYEAQNICNEKSVSVFMLPPRMRRHIMYGFIVLYFPMFFLDMVHLQLDII